MWGAIYRQYMSSVLFCQLLLLDREKTKSLSGFIYPLKIWYVCTISLLKTKNTKEKQMPCCSLFNFRQGQNAFPLSTTVDFGSSIQMENYEVKYLSLFFSSRPRFLLRQGQPNTRPISHNWWCLLRMQWLYKKQKWLRPCIFSSLFEHEFWG